MAESFLSKLTPKLLAKRLRGLRKGARAAFSDGQGAYLLAMISLGAAAMFLHRVLMPEREYREALSALVASAQEPYRGETHPVLAAGLLSDPTSWNICPDSRLLVTIDRIRQRLTHNLEHPRGPFTALVACTSDACPTPTPELGPSWTDGSAETTLFVPSTVASSLTDPTVMSTLVASQRLDDDAATIGTRFDSGRISAIYFIGLQGELRIMPSWRSHPPRLPAHRTFAGASYVFSTLSRAELACPTSVASPTQTRPYIDLAGDGIVRTLCHPIASGQRLVGTLCVDIAPPDEAIHQMLRHAAELFDLQIVRIFDHGEARGCRSPDGGGCPSELSRLTDDELDALIAKWKDGTHHDDAAGASAVRMLDGGAYFGTVIARHEPDATQSGWTDVLFGRTRRSPARDVAAALMMVVFIGIACALVVRGVARKASRLDMTLIRGLQVGVVETDRRKTIVHANDRAEEILGERLPLFGGGAPSSERSVFDVIRREILLLDDHGNLPANPELVDFQKLDELREAGRSGAYYARTVKTGLIVRISGSSIIEPAKTHHTFATIDTYIDQAHRAVVTRLFGSAAREQAPLIEVED